MTSMHKIIIAPDSYKGSLSAKRVAEILAEAAYDSIPEAEILQLPLSDGGEGLVDTLLSAVGGRKVHRKVHDPLGRTIEAFYGILSDGTAVIEMAEASGLPLLLENERNALRASSFGTGELIKDAIDRRVKNIVLGLGGSATTDGGAGAASALGIRYLDQKGNLIQNGGDLSHLVSIDTSQIVPGFDSTNIIIACDVTNPLAGPNGAAYVYAPQKGASKNDVQILDAGLMQLSRVVSHQTGIDLQSIPGTGAAGGLAVPFLAYGNAVIRSGVDVVLEAVNFDQLLEDCDMVITGEGRTDRQSSMGKVLSGVGNHCKGKGVPVIVISGTLEEGYEQLYEIGITACFSATRSISTLDLALENAEANLTESAKDVFRLLHLNNPVNHL